ncbi:MAG TPA: DUF3782 domain-containing protein [Geobacterales bacterium]|nr:DUF3782 domain-containing protein [Geobacterales bacterium]
MSTKLKKEILSLLGKDTEFRYAIAGYLGLSDILNRLDKLEQNQVKLWEEVRGIREDQMKLWENQNKLWENQNRLWEEVKAIKVEQAKIWENLNLIWNEIKAIKVEQAKIWENLNLIWNEIKGIKEEQAKIWENLNKVWEEIRALREGQNKIWESLNMTWKEITSLRVVMGSIGERWGIDLERTILKIYEDILEKEGIKAEKIEKFTYKDKEGKYVPKGVKIEIDIYVHNKDIYFIEVTAHCREEDIYNFIQKAKIVEKIINRKASRLIFIAVNIDIEALEKAKEFGIETIYGAVIEKRYRRRAQ